MGRGHLTNHEGSECFGNFLYCSYCSHCSCSPVSVQSVPGSCGSFPRPPVQLHLPPGGAVPGGGPDHLQIWSLTQWKVVVVGPRYLWSGLRADKGVLSEDVCGARP